MTKQVIWKHTLNRFNGTIHTVTVPMCAEPIMVGNQREKLCIWFRCDPSKPDSQRRYQIVGTGHFEINPRSKYVGSAIMSDGDLVWHVFDITDC